MFDALLPAPDHSGAGFFLSENGSFAVNIETMLSVRERAKQLITGAILESRFDDARKHITETLNIQKMTSSGFLFVTEYEINDFQAAINEAEIMTGNQ